MKLVGVENLLLACAALVIVSYVLYRLTVAQKRISIAGAKAAQVEEARFTSRDIIKDIGRNRHLQVNLTGSFLCARAVLPAMIRQRSGKIINIGSLSSFVGFAGNSTYGASKAGLMVFTRCLAAEVKRYGIDVNAICPSGTDMKCSIASCWASFCLPSKSNWRICGRYWAAPSCA